MLKNADGRVIQMTYNGNGNVQCEVFKNVTMLTAFEAKHEPVNEPVRFNVFVAKKVDDALSTQTPDSSKYDSYADAIQAITEDIVLAELKANPRILPHTKWDTVSYKVV